MAADSQLLERTDELGAIRQVLGDASEGRGGIVLIEGAAGVGKTSLVSAGRALAGGDGVRVLWARGRELEREFGFGVVRQLFEDLPRDAEWDRLVAGDARAALQTLDPTGNGSPEDAQAGPAVLHAIHRLVVNLAAAGPLLLAVDDAHWADASSLRALSYLAGRISSVPVALTVAMRPAEPGAPEDLLEALGGEPGIVRLSLRPLGEAAVTELVRRRLPEADDATCRACAEVTAGNPFYVTELLRAAGNGDGVEAIRAASMPSLSDRIGRRVARVSEGAPALAAAMAVIGDGGALSTAARLAGLDGVDAGRIAKRLERIEVLAGDDPFVFVHPLVRRSTYDALSIAEREDLHHRAAALLREDGATTEAVGAHLAALRPAGNDSVATGLMAAAREAMARAAPDEAIKWLRRALDENAAEPPRAEILSLLGMTEVIMWDAEAVPHLREAVALTGDTALRAKSSLALSEVLFLTGGWIEAVEVIDSALRSLGDHESDAVAGLTAIGLMVNGYAPMPIAALRTDEQTLERLIGGSSWESHALAGVLAAMTAHRGGNPDRVRELVEIAVAGGGLLDVGGRETWAVAHVLIALAEIDEYQWGMAIGESVVAAARQTGMVNLIQTADSHRAWLLARRGELAQAEEAARPALELSRQTTAPTVVASLMLYLQDLLLESPTMQDWVAALDEMEIESLGLNGTFMEAMLHIARGRVRAARGDRHRALADLRRALEIGRSLDLGPAVAPLRSLVALALGPDDRDEALALVAEELDLARASRLDRPLGLALRAAGMLEGGERGIELIAESVAPLERAGARLELARSLVELGAALRRAGRRSEARAQLTAGLQTAKECRAVPLAERAEEELRVTGGRPRRGATSGPEALTASEMRVARLAAAGATTPAIAEELVVSQKTVETHLTHAYAKLGLSGAGARSRLADALNGTEPAG